MQPLAERDESFVVALYTDSETMRFIGKPLSTARAQRFFRWASERPRPIAGPHVFVIERKIDKHPVGICGAMQVDENLLRAEVGVMLKSDARARGYGRESLEGIVSNTFDAFPLERIWVVCSALNPVVERLTRSVGFVLDDESPSGPLAQRTWSLQRSSWLARKTIQRGEGNVEHDQLS